MPFKDCGRGTMNRVLWYLLVLCPLVSCGCSGSHSADGPKLAAFRKVVAAYRDSPGDFAAPGQREKFNDRLRRVQDAFDLVPFDAAKQRDEALTILKLYESDIKGRYSGELHRQLENHIGSIADDLSFSE